MPNLLQKTLEWKGFPVSAAQKRLREIQSLSEKARGGYVSEKKWGIVQHHFENNWLYRQLLNHQLPQEWENLPVMTKKDLQKPLTDRLSNGFNQKNIFKNKTSGSSGNPFYFAKDAYCHALTWAVNFDRFQQIGIDQNHDFQARFYGIPLDKKNYYKERLKDFLAYRYRFPIFDLSDEALNKFIGVFKQKKFEYINGYTSSLVLFAKYLTTEKLVLKDVCPTLKCTVVTSEMLFEEDRKLLENAFGSPVYNEYGASELDLIAFENTALQWLLNWETLFVEVLDDQNRVLPLGQEGKLVITSLYNRAHPFIRYEIGDRGILEKASENGPLILKKLTGRTNDVALLPGGKKVPGLSFYYVTKSVMADDGLLKEFVVVQKKKDVFVIEYVRENAFNPAEENKVKSAIQQYIGGQVAVHFERFDRLQRTVAGKLKQFVSEI